MRMNNPIQINGKVRVKIVLPLALSEAAIEKEVLASKVVRKWLNGKLPKKIIIVAKRIINVVV